MKKQRSSKFFPWFYLLVILLLVIALVLATNAIVPMGAATAQIIPSLELQTVSTSLSFPVYLTSPPGDNGRLFIVERGGRIRIIKNGALLTTPFLDIRSLVSTADSEDGLLGLAFDPNYATNGRFYVSYTNNKNLRIVRYLVSGNPDIAQADADRIFITDNHPSGGHYGGDMIFGPDGYLYISMGDGGCCNDPYNNGQDLTDWMGSLLRIDVSPEGNYAIPADNPFLSNPAAKPELWNYGLRNPWRFSFDRLTGDLYIADVGQYAREEINVSTALSGRGKGLNYGWRTMEGFICTPGISPPNCNQAGLTLPVFDYNHNDGSCAVTGGYVYRGSAIPSIQGTYFYADYCTGWVRSFVYQNGQAANQTDWLLLRPGGNITSFGEDTQGEIYILTQQGGVYRIITRATTTTTTTSTTTSTITSTTTTTTTRPSTTTTRPTTTTTATTTTTILMSPGSWIQGWNMRNSLNFGRCAGGDPVHTTYAFASSIYPTFRNGSNFGWDQSAPLPEGYNENDTVDCRIAGVVEKLNNGTQARFLIDLPFASASYYVMAAVGDAGSKRARLYMQVTDSPGSGGDQTYLTIDRPNGTSFGQLVDAQNKVWTAAQWPGSNVPVLVTINTSQIAVVIGTPAAQAGSTATSLAHFSLILAGPSGTSTTTTTTPTTTTTSTTTSTITSTTTTTV